MHSESECFETKYVQSSIITDMNSMFDIIYEESDGFYFSGLWAEDVFNLKTTTLK